MGEEKKNLIKGIAISLAIIIALCFFSILFYINATGFNDYTENEAETIMIELNNQTYTLSSKDKAKFAEIFNLNEIKTATFQKNEQILYMMLSDGRSVYLYPFKYNDGEIAFINNDILITLYVSGDSLVIESNTGSIIELE